MAVANYRDKRLDITETVICKRRLQNRIEKSSYITGFVRSRSRVACGRFDFLQILEYIFDMISSNKL